MLGYSLVLASQDLTVLQGFYLSTDAYLQYLNLYPDSQTSPIYFIRFTYFPKMFAFCLSSAVAVTLIWNWNLLFKYGKLLLLPSNINLDSLSFYLGSIVGMHFLNIEIKTCSQRSRQVITDISFCLSSRIEFFCSVWNRKLLYAINEFSCQIKQYNNCHKFNY